MRRYADAARVLSPIEYDPNNHCLIIASYSTLLLMITTIDDQCTAIGRSVQLCSGQL